MPDLSEGSEDDIIIVPNIPLLNVLARVNDLSQFEKSILHSIFQMSQPKEFQKKTVREYFFGYTDSLMRMVLNQFPEQAGLISNRNGKGFINLSLLVI